MTIRQIQQKANSQKNKIGLVGGSVKVKEYDGMEHYVEAYIDPRTWDSEVRLRKGFDVLESKRQKAYARLKKIEDGLETLVLDLHIHECAHWELPVGSEMGCPYDTYNHDKILEAVKNTLPDDKKQQASYVANAFEDAVINPRAKEFKRDFAGQVLFWDWQGLECRQNNQQHYTPFYEAFVKLNMHLFGDRIDKAFLKRYYSGSQEVDNSVQSVIQDLNLPEDIIKNGNVRDLFNRQEWVQMAEIFTKNLEALLEVPPTERLSAFSDNKQGEGEDNQAGNGVEAQSKTKQGKEEIAFGRYSSDEALSTNITDYEQLDGLYRRLARAIPVNVEVMSRRDSLEIAPLTYRAFDPETDFPNRIKPSKLVLTEGGVEFAYPDRPLVVEQRAKIQRKSFPDFKLILLDNSGSMACALDGSDNVGKTNFISWGDESKYHYALLGFYGIENFLQMQGISQYIEHGLSLFSSQTRYKQGSFFELDKIRKMALAPEWGSTKLNAGVLKKALQGKESFALSVSDGAIDNWSSERDSIKELIGGNYFAHIQIGGGDTQFTKDLKSWQVPVFDVDSGQDLSKLMVDITKKTYERFTRQ